MAGIAALTGCSERSRKKLDLQTVRVFKRVSERCVKDAD